MCLCLLLAAGSCPAGRITLAVDAASAFRGGHTTVSATVVNRGTEPAMDLRVEARVRGQSVQGEPHARLEVDDRLAVELAVPPPAPGVHTAVVVIRYADLNGHTFSALAAIPLVTGIPDPAADFVRARLSPLWLRAAGAVELALTNEGEQPVDVTVRLHLPDEVTCANPVRTVSLPAGGYAECRFDVECGRALPGSRYAVFAVMDYTVAGRPHSVMARGTVHIRPPPRVRFNPWLWGGVAVALLAVFGLLQVKDAGRKEGRGQAIWRFLASLGMTTGKPGTWFDILVLLAIFAYTAWHLHPELWFVDTMTVGGDTPAHNYLAGHLKASLFGQGHIVSWAGGWWCGFPMFQFYFCLPYLLMVLLDVVMPFNIAFKLVSVLGLLALSPCAYAAGRLLCPRRPTPLLLAVATVPLLFDTTHTMWGVNVYSTLAGMLANSLSFPLMLLAIALADRDVRAGAIRLRTVFLLTALLASHFFTSLVAALVLALLPFTCPPAGRRRALVVLAAEGALAVGLMAWWLVPLAARQAETVQFGVNWVVSLHKQLPACVIGAIPLALAGIALGIRRRIRFVAIAGWMLAGAALLFAFGYALSPVFVNVRLWPFMLFAVLALAAVGAGELLAGRRRPEVAVLAVLVAVLAFAPEHPNSIRSWAKWNYEGLQRKRRWPVFEKLVLPLRGTPGRLANDLHADNKALGSTRIFEAAPHLAGKPILEGGILSGATTSLFSYYIQGETSKACAGFPTIVQPAAFHPVNATRHLRLFNVKHFLARWEKTQRALDASPDWKRIATESGWNLYELTTHDGSHVFIPSHDPTPVHTTNWQVTALEWIYDIDQLDHPRLLLRPGEPPPIPVAASVSERIPGQPERSARLRSQLRGGEVQDEVVTDSCIRFRTTAIGRPHIIRCSYYPTWQVTGAKKIYRVTPNFMLVYPETAAVELRYGRGAPEWLGLVVSAGSVLGVAGWAWRRRCFRNSG